MNFAFWWPIGALVLANLTYHFCFKLIPASVNLFASLTVTYLFASVAALLCVGILLLQVSFWGSIQKLIGLLSFWVFVDWFGSRCLLYV